jgi:hypothetical protein
MEPRNRFQGMNSASLCSLAGRYDNPIPPRFLAPIDCLKIPARIFSIRKSLAGRYDNPIPPRFLAPIDCLKIPARIFSIRKSCDVPHFCNHLNVHYRQYSYVEEKNMYLPKYTLYCAKIFPDEFYLATIPRERQCIMSSPIKINL